jgi:hypothetical protein
LNAVVVPVPRIPLRFHVNHDDGGSKYQ